MGKEYGKIVCEEQIQIATNIKKILNLIKSKGKTITNKVLFSNQ